MKNRKIRKAIKWVKKVPKKGMALAALLVGKILPIGGKKGTPYKRDFTGIEARVQLDKFLRPQEFLDPDEDNLFEKLAIAFADDTLKLPVGCAKADVDFQDPHWGHTTGLLHGSLTIDNVAALEEEFRVGLFAQNRTYRAVCRPNFLYDDEPLIAISRMSLKLEYPDPVPNLYTESEVANELDLLLSEGLARVLGGDLDGRGFFFRDARQLMMANDMKTGPKAAIGVLLNSASGKVVMRWKKIFGENTDMLYKPPQTRTGWAGKRYFSAGPYALGDGAMKFCLEPLQEHVIKELDVDLDNPAKFHKSTLLEWAKTGKDVRFDLCVQIATIDSIPEPGPEDPPKPVMAVEYTDLAWDEGKAPFRRVGTLTLKAREADEADEDARWYALPFNAWNTFEAMKPLGQLFRARKVVHRHHRNTRLSHSFNANPDVVVGRCPYSP